MQIHARTEKLIGLDALEKLKGSKVLVVGAGGVGGYVVEALARSGVGFLTVVDKDVVDESNINRQIIALASTVGRPKTAVIKERIADINPEIKVNALDLFVTPENVDGLNVNEFDYVVDAVDFIPAKVALVAASKSVGVPVISAMGAGNKLDPTRIRVCDVEKTDVCPLARVMRREARKHNLGHFKVAYSDELPVIADRVPASYACVPATMGLIIAAEVIKDLIGK